MVQSATLRLYAASWKNNRTLQALRINAAWTEGGVKWNNQPATTGTAATTTSGSGYRQWNVTAQVQAMFAANYGFLIRDATESGGGNEQQFHSREKGESMPQLVVQYAQAVSGAMLQADLASDTTDPNVMHEGEAGELVAVLYLPLIQRVGSQPETQLVDNADAVVANDAESTAPPAQMAEQAGKIYLPLVPHAVHTQPTVTDNVGKGEAPPPVESPAENQLPVNQAETSTTDLPTVDADRRTEEPTEVELANKIHLPLLVR